MGRFRTKIKMIFQHTNKELSNLHRTQELKDQKQASNEKTITEANYEKTFAKFGDSFDLVHRSFHQDQIRIIYLSSLVDSNSLEWEILSPLRETPFNQFEQSFQQSLFKQVDDQEEVTKGLLDGHAAMFAGKYTYLVNVSGLEERAISQSETETVINGPHDSFNEALKTNVSLIRRRVRSSRLKMITLSVGEISKTKVILIYIEGIAKMDIVNHLRERIHSIKSIPSRTPMF